MSGKGAASPPPPPLRTVREGFPSYGSSRPLPSVLPEALSRMGRCVASGSVCRPIAGSHLTWPFGLHNPPGSCRVVHPAHVSRLSARAMRPYPPGHDFPWPFGGWHSLLGPSCSHCGLGPSFRRSSGLLARGQTALGLPRSAPVETRRGWVPPLLRGLGAPACPRWHALTRRRSRSGSWPVHRRVSHRLRRPFVTQPQRRFILIHPSRLSLTRFAWMVQAHLGFHPSALVRHVTGALARVGN